MSQPARLKTDTDEVSAARQLGRQEGEAFDRKLRAREDRERAARLTEIVWQQRKTGEQADDGHSSYEVARLEERVGELNHYLAAIEKSLAWRTIQWCRSLVGRKW